MSRDGYARQRLLRCLQRALRAWTVAAAIATSLAVTSTATASATYPVKLGDDVAVRNSNMYCKVGAGDARRRAVLVTCLLLRRSGSSIVGSYGFSIGDLGIAILKSNATTPSVVYVTRYAVTNLGVIAPPDPFRGVRLVTLGIGDAIAVSGTDLGCVVVGQRTSPTLVCKRRFAPQAYEKINPPLVTLSDQWIRVGAAHIVVLPNPALFARKEPRAG